MIFKTQSVGSGSKWNTGYRVGFGYPLDTVWPRYFELPATRWFSKLNRVGTGSPTRPDVQRAPEPRPDTRYFTVWHRRWLPWWPPPWTTARRSVICRQITNWRPGEIQRQSNRLHKKRLNKHYINWEMNWISIDCFTNMTVEVGLVWKDRRNPKSREWIAAAR